MFTPLRSILTFMPIYIESVIFARQILTVYSKKVSNLDLEVSSRIPPQICMYFLYFSKYVGFRANIYKQEYLR